MKIRFRQLIYIFNLINLKLIKLFNSLCYMRHEIKLKIANINFYSILMDISFKC